jgi:hypothetical protein
MANTEGIPDEVLESILNHSPSVTPTTATATKTTNNPSTTTATAAASKPKDAPLKKSAWQRRIDNLPMGERPAATVIQRSGRSTAMQDSVLEGADVPTPTANQSQDLAPPPLVVGSIVERPRNKGLDRPKRRDLRNPEEMTLEEIERMEAAPSDTRPVLDPSNTGFPSVYVPLGTFVKSPPTTAAAAASQPSLEATTPVTSSRPSINAQDWNDLRQASAQDAQAMLQHLSPQEINEQVAELQQTLSPELVSYFKQRATKSSPATTTATASTQPASTTTVTASSENRKKPAVTFKDTENTNEHLFAKEPNSHDTKQPDKEEFAHLMSSIQSHLDLDAAYQFVMGTVSENDFDDTPMKNDFEMACELLRSSASRQTLWAARCVSEQLHTDVLLRNNAKHKEATDWPYLTILPVSLRCLLDTSLSKASGFLLHTYALQALYSLLRLRVCSNHDIDVTGATLTESMAYQLYTMNDAIPTTSPSACYKSSAVQSMTIEGMNNVAYSTSSSSTSAQADGEAFLHDPLWTLLSRMRILPRLAEILACRSPPVPTEALVSICGILALVAQRSAGAATAIVQHPTLLRNLADRTLHPHEGCARCDPQGATPIMILYGTLARQSRLAAQGIIASVHAELFQIVSLLPRDKPEWILQQWTLILWRTLLRYGLGLELLNSLLTVSTRHLVLGSHHEWSLAADWYSAFAQVLRCVWSSRVSRLDSTTPTNDSNNHTNELDEILFHAESWMSSVARGALTGPTTENCKDTTHYSHQAQYWASRLRFLDTWLLILDGDDTVERSEHKSENMDIDNLHKICQCLMELTTSGLVEQSFVVTNELVVLDLDVTNPSVDLYVALGFLESLFRILTSLRSWLRLLDDSSVLTSIKTYLIQLLHTNIRVLLTIKNASVVPRGLRAMCNGLNVSVLKYLESRSDPDWLYASRVLSFATLGSLDVGEESTAAVLLSSDILYQPSSAMSSAANAPLSSFLMGALCNSVRAQAQLDHSFKRSNGLGITAQGKGPFELQTLLCENLDRPSAAREWSLLPLGPYWLWQCLAGSDLEGSGRVANGKSVIQDTLELIHEFEFGVDEYNYARGLDAAPKIYFMMNLCIHGESFLTLVDESPYAHPLMDQYAGQMNDLFLTRFSQACLDHYTLHSPADENVTVALTKEEEQFAVLLEEPDVTSIVTKEAYRAVLALVSDLTDAFVEYGAPYSFFTRCIRLLIYPQFPFKIRSDVMTRLKGLWHLLSVPDENMWVPIDHFMHSKHQCPAHHAAFLDASVTTLAHGAVTRQVSGFLPYLTATLLAEQIGHSIRQGESLATTQRQMQRVDRSIARLSMILARHFVETGYDSSKPWVAIPDTLNADMQELNNNTASEIDDLTWSSFVKELQAIWQQSNQVLE